MPGLKFSQITTFDMADLNEMYSDVLWIAADLDDNVATFTSATQGPIPKAIIDERILLLDDLEEFVNKMPVVCEYRRVDKYKDIYGIDWYPNQGFYCYDWTNLESCRTLRYHLVGIPSNALKIDQLPVPLQAVLAEMPRMKLHFSESLSINPADFIDCYVPEPKR